MKRTITCLFALSILASQCPSQSVILDMDTVRHQPGTFGDAKTPGASVVKQAVRVSGELTVSAMQQVAW